MYDTIPPFKTAVTRKASMAATGKWVVEDLDGELQDDQRARDAVALLNNPNPVQTGKQWLKQNRKQYYVYANSFIYANRGLISNQLPVTLSNLPAGDIQVTLSGKLYDQTNIEDIILGYKLPQGNNQTRVFETKDVLLLADCDLDNPILGESITKALRYPLSNVDGAYRSRNVLINQRGAHGVLFGKSKDGDGGLPFSNTEQKNISKQYVKDFGTKEGQVPIMMNEGEVGFIKLSIPVDELRLFEEVESGYIDFLDMLGLNINISPRAKGTTFENLKQGLIMAYNDTIIPEGEDLAQGLTTFLGLDQQNRRLRLSYDHLAILQKNKKEQSEVLLNASRSINQLGSAGAQSLEEQSNAIAEALGTLPG